MLESTLLAKMKALRTFEASTSIYDYTRPNIQEDLNFQHRRFENLRLRNLPVLDLRDLQELPESF